MKGIAHFLTGVALSTFIPDVVHRAAGGSLLPVLGGIAGILPDTLDFKFVRFFERHDAVVDPGRDPDPWRIAGEVAGAMRQAYEDRHPRTVMLHTIRAGADRWRRYCVEIDAAGGDVVVRVGPLVSTAQAIIPGSQPAHGHEARLSAGVPLSPGQGTVVEIDIFTGPTMTFERQGDGLAVRVLDWHRRWTHSLTFAAVAALAAGGTAALIEWLTRGGPTRLALLCGLVVGLGILGHIVEDQMGVMGSNLLYPFTRRRSSGLRWTHSADAIPNILAALVSLSVVLLNLDRFSPRPRLEPLWFAAVFIVLPVLALGAAYAWRRTRARDGATDHLPPEVLAEMAESDPLPVA